MGERVGGWVESWMKDGVKRGKKREGEERWR